ncbi:MAG: bifunctional (p)ppGpp synthetase/guanosine-3',5'-bis(diphosphate) 3'-pyrophosphohydrolase [Muribaculaceae bacterium]|nr:bifunctional (p)ppGpp synthetase/guanosine-3',5'-bis(diphosphate) 3'-pyrophosphohydrolase [Muribaculaceae bacterium]
MTQEEENKIIDDAYQELLNGYLSSNHRKKVEKIEKAYRFARRAHDGIRRRSGEPYILHPIAVATIVSQEIGMGSTSICAALLHDVVEDTEYTAEDIKAIFGDEVIPDTGEKVGDKIANIVDGLTKISGGIFGDKASVQAENFKKLLLTMNKDVRVILIKIADRLHNMRTLASMPPAKQYKIAGETLYIYAPVAHRLGLFAIKSELEDLSFKYEHPDTYKSILDAVEASAGKRNDMFERFSAPIRERLDAVGLNYEFKARVKSCYSIWKKMQAKRIPIDEIYDIYAARIVFDCPDDKEENLTCWAIYNEITKIYNKIHPGRIRDWLTRAKPNGYRALHLTVMGPDAEWIEVQIRSRKMDNIDERGMTAHWIYKNGNGELEEDVQLEEWIREIDDILKTQEPNALDLLDSIKLNLYASEITVFTPKRDTFTLPKGATVLDLAFTIHSEIGYHCIAGKVNHNLVPISHKLSSGDRVEILTSQTMKPEPEWSKFVVSAKGKTRLNQAFRHMRREVMDRGEEQFKEFMAHNSAEINNENLTRIISALGVQNKEDLYYKIGNGDITLTPVMLKALKPASQNLLSKLWRSSFGGKAPKESQTESDEPAAEEIDRKKVYMLKTVDGKTNYRLSKCCHPLPGDDVVAFVSYKNEVLVHKIDCPTAMRLKSGYGGRIIETQWQLSNETFFASIKVEGVDRMGILQEIIYLISTNLSINIRRLSITSNAGVFMCEMDVLVEDVDAVTKMCKRLGKVKGVTKATRQS